MAGRPADPDRGAGSFLTHVAGSKRIGLPEASCLG